MITLDTPYTGSQFSTNLFNSNPLCKNLFPHPVGQAVTDLAVGSVAFANLQGKGSNLFTHAVSGFASDQQTITAESNVDLTTKTFCPALLPTGKFTDVFSGASDLIVSVASQWDLPSGGVGLPLSALSEVDGVIHAVDASLFTLGPDALSRGIKNGQIVYQDSGNGQLVIDLLNQSRQTSVFTGIMP